MPGAAVRLRALEDYCSAQSEAAVVAAEWNHDISGRVGELEQKVDDLELIRITEIRDERHDRVAALEDAAAVFDEWRPWVEASIHDMRLEIKRATQPRASSSTDPGVVSFPELASARPSAGAKAG